MPDPPAPDPWTAESVVDADLARRLVETQFPHLAPVRVEPLGAGWDNTAYVVNGAWVFRFPRRETALALNARELLLLPAVAPRVPLPVPRPELIGRADESFRWPFAGYRLLPGRTLCSAGLDDAQRLAAAEPLGRFVAALHSFPAGQAEALGARPDDIGKLDVPHRARQTRAALAELRDRGVVPAHDLAPLERALDVPESPSAAGVFVHGDLYALHVLVDALGRPCGVIDWGDCHLGDPAVDLSLAHLVLPPAAHASFRSAYGPVDDTTWRRARFRAVVHATACVKYALAIGDADLLRETRLALRWAAGR